MLSLMIFIEIFSTLAETQRLDRLDSIRHRRFLRWNEQDILFQMFMIYRISVFLSLIKTDFL